MDGPFRSRAVAGTAWLRGERSGGRDRCKAVAYNADGFPLGGQPDLSGAKDRCPSEVGTPADAHFHGKEAVPGASPGEGLVKPNLGGCGPFSQ